MIPPVAHFIWFGPRLPWANALSIRAAALRGGFEQAWRLYNTSITRVIYSGDRMTLDGFNEVAHLSRGDWTHR